MGIFCFILFFFLLFILLLFLLFFCLSQITNCWFIRDFVGSLVYLICFRFVFCPRFFAQNFQLLHLLLVGSNFDDWKRKFHSVIICILFRKKKCDCRRDRIGCCYSALLLVFLSAYGKKITQNAVLCHLKCNRNLVWPPLNYNFSTPKLTWKSKWCIAVYCIRWVLTTEIFLRKILCTRHLQIRVTNDSFGMNIWLLSNTFTQYHRAVHRCRIRRIFEEKLHQKNMYNVSTVLFLVRIEGRQERRVLKSNGVKTMQFQNVEKPNHEPFFRHIIFFFYFFTLL